MAVDEYTAELGYEINKIINIMHQKKYVAITSNYQSSIYFCHLFAQTDRLHKSAESFDIVFFFIAVPASE